jgi:hypothetical protein
VARFEKMGDLFEPLLELRQKMPDLRTAAAAAQPEPVEIAAPADEAYPAPGKKRAGKKR